MPPQAHPVLSRFDLFLYKPKNPVTTDVSQVPATDAHIEFFYQGATTKARMSPIPGRSSANNLDVYDAGDVWGGDLVQVGIGGPRLSVDSVESLTRLKVSNAAAFDIPIVDGTRLIVVSKRPRASVLEETTIGVSQSGVVFVDSSERFAVGDTLQVGLSGTAFLLITKITQVPPVEPELNRCELGVTNVSNVTADLVEGALLIRLTTRPVAYLDSLGQSALGPALAPEASTGRVSAYLAQARLDYLETGSVQVDAVSSCPLQGGATMQFKHAVAGVSRYLLVGVSWTPALVPPGPSVVSYGGQSLGNPIVQDPNIAVYGLVNPQVGTNDVTVQFPAGSQVDAVAGTVSLVGVDPVNPVGAVGGESDENDTPSIQLSGTDPNSLVVDVLSVLPQDVPHVSTFP